MPAIQRNRDLVSIPLTIGLALVLAAFIFSAAFLLPRSRYPSPADTESVLERSPVQIITTADALRDSLATGQHILFVDCGWNGDVVAFRFPFAAFATWCEQNSIQTLSVKVDSESKDELWHMLQQMWRDNRILEGGLKNYGGAGRVVWFRDGQIVDYAWCSEVHSVALLRARTSKAFDWELASASGDDW